MNILYACPTRKNLHRALKRTSIEIAKKIAMANRNITFDFAFYEDDNEGIKDVNGYNEAHNQRTSEVRNALIENYLEDHHDYVFWIDADIIRASAYLPTKLLSANNGVTAPLVFLDKHRPRFYDIGGFVKNGKWANPMPPYFRYDGNFTQMDSVGCCYTIPAHVYRSGGKYRPTPGFVEHYSICDKAIGMGYKVGCLLTESVAHANLDEYKIQKITHPNGKTYGLYVVEDHRTHPHWRYFDEPETSKWLVDNVQKDWRCFDIGAGVGELTVLMADLCNSVVAIEAHPLVYNMLVDTTIHLDNVHTVDAAVADGKPIDKISFGGMLKPTSVDMFPTTIDSLTNYGDERLDLLKIDIDGLDFQALLGAKETLTYQKPKILVEVYEPSLERFGYKASDIIQYLNGFGYSAIATFDKSSNVLFEVVDV